MHLSHIPQCTILNRNVHISVLNGALWDMGKCIGLCEIGLFLFHQNAMDYWIIRLNSYMLLAALPSEDLGYRSRILLCIYLAMAICNRRSRCCTSTSWTEKTFRFSHAGHVTEFPDFSYPSDHRGRRGSGDKWLCNLTYVCGFCRCCCFGVWVPKYSRLVRR